MRLSLIPCAAFLLRDDSTGSWSAMRATDGWRSSTGVRGCVGQFAHDAKVVYQQLLEHGVVTNAVTPTALRFAPPLNVARSEIDEVIAVLRRLLS